MIRMCKCDKHGVVKHKFTLVCELCTAENTVGTQPTDVQQLKAEIAALATDLECHMYHQFTSEMYVELRSRLRQLSAV